jgi:iron(III) transport system permease protein
VAELSASGPQPKRGLLTALRHSLRAAPVMCSVVLLVMVVLVVYPLALLLEASFLVEGDDGTKAYGMELWATAWDVPGLVPSILNTFRRVIATEILAFPIAILIAWAVARTDLPGKKLIEAFFWIAFFLPALPVLMGWILLFDPQFGLANQAWVAVTGAEKGPFNIYSFSGIIFAHIAARSVAAKYIFLSPAFRNVGGAMEEASRIAGAGPLRTLVRIVVPVLTPAILITLCISMIHSLESFEIELILGAPINFYVFSTKIYQFIQEDPPMFGVSTVLGLAILMCMLPLIFWQQYLSHKRSYVTVTSHFAANPLRLRRWRTPVFTLICAFGVLITVVPIAFLLLGTFMSLYGHFGLEDAWTLEHWAAVLTDGDVLGAVGNTMILGAAAAVFGALWYALVAYISVRTRYRARGVLDFLSWLPASLPGIILGLALLWMFLNVPLFQPLYGTVIVLVVACILNSISTGVQLIKSNMVQLGNDLEEASFIVGGSWLLTFRRIVLPLLAPVLIAVGLLTFVSAARNVSTIAMLVTADSRPLSMLQVDHIVDGTFESAAVVGVLIVLLTFGMAVIARAIGQRFGFSGIR